MGTKMKSALSDVMELPILSDPNCAPKGQMVTYLGQQLDSTRIGENNSEFLSLEKIAKYRDLQVWIVRPLLGKCFTVTTDLQLSQGLLGLLQSIFPQIPWVDVEVSPLHLRKYFIINTSIPAPMNEATMQPMSIEIFGCMKSIIGSPGTYENALSKIWPPEHGMSQIWDMQIEFFKTVKDMVKDMEDRFNRPLQGEITIEITQAVYSNLMYPNISGSFYM